ncbi:hypothetical protein ACFXGA_20400 [Actinosynnema sp. NPDC059335]|uniref:hypothetical protein n=1 Tax=Actinosynnema sp. NPDC059335 TaxID=3346804 RepID=UPI0036704780
MADFAAPVRPAPVRTAVNLFYAGLAATVLAVLVVIVDQAGPDGLGANFRSAYSSYSAEKLAEVKGITLTYLFTLGVLSALVYLALIRAVRKGKGWARIAAIVVFAVGTALGFYHFGENFPVLVTLSGILVGVVGLVAAVALWTPAASAYFSRKTAH